MNAASPLVIGDEIFVSACYGTGAALLRFKESGPKKLWSADGVLSSHYATSVHHDGFLYGFDGRQEEGPNLRCVELKTGQVRWSQDNFGAGTIILAGDRLLVLRVSPAAECSCSCRHTADDGWAETTPETFILTFLRTILLRPRNGCPTAASAQRPISTTTACCYFSRSNMAIHAEPPDWALIHLGGTNSHRPPRRVWSRSSPRQPIAPAEHVYSQLYSSGVRLIELNLIARMPGERKLHEEKFVAVLWRRPLRTGVLRPNKIRLAMMEIA